jgi:hypothetical protein
VCDFKVGRRRKTQNIKNENIPRRKCKSSEGVLKRVLVNTFIQIDLMEGWEFIVLRSCHIAKKN